MSGPDQPGPFDDAPIIFRYTRAQALEDGVLVDLSPWAAELGFVLPVACTAAVWQRYVVPPEKTRDLGQSERGRVHDLLWMLYNAIRRIRRGGRDDTVSFQVLFLQSPHQHETVTLKAVRAPGDLGEPVITVMLPDED